MLGAGIATVTTQLNIVQFYRKNDVSLADSMVHLSSGKRVLKPEDNTGDFFRSRRIDGENRSYHYIRRDIGAAIGMTEAGEEVGRQVFEQVSHLRRLVKDYYDPATSDEGKQAIESEFYALSQSVSDTIGQAEYDDRQLVSAGTLRSFTLDPHNRTTTFDIVIEADEVVDGAALTSIDISGGEVAALAAVDAELEKAGSYLARMIVYTDALVSHDRMIADRMAENRNIDGILTNADQGREMMAVVEKEMRSQISLAMLAQSNMVRGGLLSLVAPR